MSPALIQHFETFVEYSDAKEFSTHLRKMLISFMRSNGKDELFADDLLYEMDGLFDLLQAIQDHGKKS